MVNDVTDTDPILTNGPDDDVELNTPYHAAPADASHDMVIEVDDLGVAVTPVGVAGGGCSVVADTGGLDSADTPPVFAPLTS